MKKKIIYLSLFCSFPLNASATISTLKDCVVGSNETWINFQPSLYVITLNHDELHFNGTSENGAPLAVLNNQYTNATFTPSTLSTGSFGQFKFTWTDGRILEFTVLPPANTIVNETHRRSSDGNCYVWTVCATESGHPLNCDVIPPPPRW